MPLAGFFSAAVAAAGRRLRPDRAHDRGRVGDAARPREGRATRSRSIPGTKAVLLTQSETSTGVIQPIEELAARRQRRGGARRRRRRSRASAPCRSSSTAWGLDVAVGGSQKALSASPGIAFVAVSDRARGRRARRRRSRGSTSTGASTARFAALPDPENPWTPAISVMQGLARGARAVLPGRGRRRARAARDAEPRRQGRRARDRARPVRRGARGQLDRHGDPRARGDRRRRDLRPDPRRTSGACSRPARGRSRARSSGSGTSATSASSTSSAGSRRSR